MRGWTCAWLIFCACPKPPDPIGEAARAGYQHAQDISHGAGALKDLHLLAAIKGDQHRLLVVRGTSVLDLGPGPADEPSRLMATIDAFSPLNDVAHVSVDERPFQLEQSSATTSAWLVWVRPAGALVSCPLAKGHSFSVSKAGVDRRGQTQVTASFLAEDPQYLVFEEKTVNDSSEQEHGAPAKTTHTEQLKHYVLYSDGGCGEAPAGQ